MVLSKVLSENRTQASFPRLYLGPVTQAPLIVTGALLWSSYLPLDPNAHHSLPHIESMGGSPGDVS